MSAELFGSSHGVQMIIYSSTLAEFRARVEDRTIADLVDAACIANGLGHRQNELPAWRNSLPQVYFELGGSSLPDDVDVAIEYSIPLTSRSRVDLMFCGQDERGVGTVVIVELKQWSKVEALPEMPNMVRTYVGGRDGEQQHPSRQAWTYAEAIKNFNLDVQTQAIALNPCAWLHNYKREPAPSGIYDPIYAQWLTKSPSFCASDPHALRDFICKHIRKSDGGERLWAIENGKLRPSRQLQDAMASMLEGNQEFTLIDEQIEVFDKARYLARKTKDDGVKRVMIVEGGPGTGKSVVAISLLVDLIQAGMIPQYISKNRAPRKVYAAKLRGTNKTVYIDSLFKGSSHLYTAPANSIDAVLIDEAHRLTEKSDMYGVQGENQIREAIAAARFSVFFIDEAQRIHINDIGRVSDIEKAAMDAGAEVHKACLPSQFRCAGSDSYLEWLEDLLRTEPHGVTKRELNYDFRVFDSPTAMMEEIVRLNEPDNRSRVVAGYCWDWPTKTRANRDHPDIVLEGHGFSASWNLSSTETWAIDPQSVHQVGCIHTAQGLEFDYVGVLIGDDMRLENGRVVTDYTKRSKNDQSMKGIKKLATSDLDAAQRLSDSLIRNTYRVLMTRGIKGCFVFCTDAALAAHFREQLEGAAKTSGAYALGSQTLPLVAEDSCDRD